MPYAWSDIVYAGIGVCAFLLGVYSFYEGELSAASVRGNVLEADRRFAVGMNLGREKGWKQYAEKNKTELETIKRAQETLIRAAQKNEQGYRPDRTVLREGSIAARAN